MTLNADLCSDQEEADTRIVLHCIHAMKASANATPIIVRSPDTDLLVILSSYASSVSQPLFLDTGTGNNRRLIDVQSIAAALGSDMCAALPAYHAFTGSDYTSAFVHKGKIKPFEMLRKKPDFISVFKHLGSEINVEKDTLEALEHFVCCMYGRPTYRDVNALRYKLFQARYDVKSTTTGLTIPPGVDSSLLPPCRSSLQMHAKRANYVANVWKNSHIAYPKLPSPIGLGWMSAADGSVTIQWTDGDILPQQLIDIMSPTSDAVSAAHCDADDEDDDVPHVEEEELEEDYEIDNILDVFFEDEQEEQ